MSLKVTFFTVSVRKNESKYKMSDSLPFKKKLYVINLSYFNKIWRIEIIQK